MNWNLILKIIKFQKHLFMVQINCIQKSFKKTKINNYY